MVEQPTYQEPLEVSSSLCETTAGCEDLVPALPCSLLYVWHRRLHLSSDSDSRATGHAPHACFESVIYSGLSSVLAHQPHNISNILTHSTISSVKGTSVELHPRSLRDLYVRFDRIVNLLPLQPRRCRRCTTKAGRRTGRRSIQRPS